MSTQPKQNPILIGLIGGIGSGKTTVAEYLIEKYKFDEYSFAKPVKDIAIAMGFEHSQVYGTQSQKLEKNKYWNISAREFLQKLGTDIGRDSMPKLIPDMNMGESGTPWVRLFEIHWGKLLEKTPYPVLVVSDCRFRDEVESVQARGGYIIKIVRPSDENDDEKKGTEYNHTSESGIDTLHHNMCIVNDGTKEKLYESVDIGILYAKGFLK